MRISKLDILGYGKWIDQKFEISSDFHVFYGPNESGKSTLKSFIHSILFGFPTRNQKLNRYEPKYSSKYGGRIHVKDSIYGPLMIERLPHHKVTGEVKIHLPNHQTLDETYLPHILHHTSASLYNAIFTFDLEEMEKINDLKADELEKTFLNMSVSGAHNYHKLANELESNAQKLYKPTGRVPAINQALESLQDAKESLYIAESKNKDYLNKLRQVKAIDETIRKKDQLMNKLQQDRRQYQFVLDNWDDFSYYLYLIYDFKKHEQTLSEDDGVLAEKLIEQNNQLSHEMDQLQAELNMLQKNHFSSDLMDHYVMNKVYYDEWFDKEPYLTEQLTQFHQIQRSISDKITSHHRLARKLGLNPNAQTPFKIADEDINKVKTWDDSLNNLEEKANQLDKELYKINYKLNHAKIEAPNNNQNLFLPLIFAGFIFILLTLSGYIIDLSLMMSIIIGAFSATVVHYFIKRHSVRNNGAVDDNPSADHLKVVKNELTESMKKVYTEMDLKNESYHLFLQKHHLPESLSISECLINYDLYNDYIDQSDEIVRLKTMLNNEVSRLKIQTEDLDHLGDIYSANVTPEQRIQNLAEIKQAVDKQTKSKNQTMYQIESKTEELRVLEKQLNLVESKLNELLDKYQLTSVMALKQLNDVSKANKTKLNDLKTLRQLFNGYQEIAKKSLTENEVNCTLVDIDNELKKLAEEKNKQMDQKATTIMELRELEEGKDYALKRQQYENQVSKIDGLIEEWLVNKAGSDLITLTLKEHTKEQLPKILNLATDYFNRLTEGKYTAIELKNNRIQVVTSNQERFRVNELSRGTSEPLYAALRLSVIQLQAKEISLPILIDDSFVNLDSVRKSIMYDILEEISQVTQVLFFTFDKQLLNRFKDEQITYL
ncbi:MAG TPA: AAA family ATPase [Alloiococcus sp.]|nr:AAA family ATPase [Alloiococcus sp.]